MTAWIFAAAGLVVAIAMFVLSDTALQNSGRRQQIQLAALLALILFLLAALVVSVADAVRVNRERNAVPEAGTD